ncbi:MAG: hypothetical protein NVS1B14_04110 [Vulcanimicrobiaceae bacterium]
MPANVDLDAHSRRIVDDEEPPSRSETLAYACTVASGVIQVHGVDPTIVAAQSLLIVEALTARIWPPPPAEPSKSALPAEVFLS